MAESDSKNAQEVRRYTHGIMLYRRGMYERAVDELAPVAPREDMIGRVARFYYAMAHRRLGIEALQAGRFCQAEGFFRAAMEAAGRKPDLSAHLAAMYAKTNRHELCTAEMERLADSPGDGPQTRRQLAQAQWRGGKRAEAYMTLTAALRKFPTEGKLHMQLGLFYAAEEQVEKACEQLNKAVEADCSSADNHYYLGLVAAARRDLQTAVRSFQRAFELRPEDLVIAHQLALAAKAAAQNGSHFLLRLPEPAPATADSHIAQLAHYVTDEPDFVGAFLALPPSEADSELFSMLAGVLQIALDKHPRYADLHYHSSRIFHRLGQMDAAVYHARRAVGINPRYLEALVHIAHLCAEADRPAEAVDYLEQAISHGGDWPDVHYLAGKLLVRCDKQQQARGHFQRALQLKTNYPGAAEMLHSLAA